MHPPLQIGGVVTAIITFFICLFDRSAEPDKLLPESRHIGLPSVDGGHGALRGQDQEQGLAERELGHPDRKSTSKRGAPKGPSQGSRKKGGGKFTGQNFSGIVTVGRRVFVSLHIGGPVPGDKLFQ